MDDLDKKFDRAEKFVERGGKLILKVVTGFVGIALAIIFAWGQINDTLDDHGIHVHAEDEEFQEYLIDMETSAGYYEEEVDSAYEDSLYNVYYHLDEVVEDTVEIELDTVEVDNMDMPDLVDVIEVDTVAVEVDTLSVDTIAVDTIN